MLRPFTALAPTLPSRAASAAPQAHRTLSPLIASLRLAHANVQPSLATRISYTLSCPSQLASRSNKLRPTDAPAKSLTNQNPAATLIQAMTAAQRQDQLMDACAMGDLKAARSLIESGANLNEALSPPNLAGQLSDEDDRGLQPETPLTLAVKSQSENIVDYLIEQGAEVNWRNYAGESPLLFAAQKGNCELIRSLIQAGADVNGTTYDDNTALIAASGSGSLESVVELLESGADPQTWGDALLAAAFAGHPTIAQTLIEYGGNANYTAGYGMTPLLAACMADRPEVINVLLDHEADTNCRFKELGPADVAIACENPSVIHTLAARGVDINNRDATGSTTVHRAARSGLASMITALADAGANVNVVNELGWTPLAIATNEGFTEAGRTLIQAGANVNALLPNGLSVLMLASRNNKPDLIKTLMEHGANLHYARNQQTAALSALMHESQVVGASLDDIMIDLDQIPTAGSTALHHAAAKGAVDAMEILIRRGADLNHPNEKGDTPLMVACGNGYEAAARTCVRAGADTQHMNQHGETAKAKAIFSGNEDFIGFFDQGQQQ